MSRFSLLTTRLSAMLTLLLITLAHANPPAPGLPVQPNCPVPVCGYGGTATFEELVGDTLLITAEANVTWTFSHMSGRLAVYSGTGTLTISWDEEHCRISLDPSTGKIDPTSSNVSLTIDFTATPVRYSGHASGGWEGEQTWRCPNSEPFTQEGVSAVWFRVYEAVTPHASTLSGSEQSELVRATWDFVHGY